MQVRYIWETDYHALTTCISTIQKLGDATTLRVATETATANPNPNTNRDPLIKHHRDHSTLSLISMSVQKLRSERCWLFFFIGERGSSKIPFSEFADTSESSVLCQGQKLKGWYTGGIRCKQTMSCMYSSESGRHLIVSTNWNTHLDHIGTSTSRHISLFKGMLCYCLKWEDINYAF